MTGISRSERLIERTLVLGFVLAVVWAQTASADECDPTITFTGRCDQSDVGGNDDLIEGWQTACQDKGGMWYNNWGSGPVEDPVDLTFPEDGDNVLIPAPWTVVGPMPVGLDLNCVVIQPGAQGPSGGTVNVLKGAQVNQSGGSYTINVGGAVNTYVQTGGSVSSPGSIGIGQLDLNAPIVGRWGVFDLSIGSADIEGFWQFTSSGQQDETRIAGLLRLLSGATVTGHATHRLIIEPTGAVEVASGVDPVTLTHVNLEYYGHAFTVNTDVTITGGATKIFDGFDFDIADGVVFSLSGGVLRNGAAGPGDFIGTNVRVPFDASVSFENFQANTGSNTVHVDGALEVLNQFRFPRGNLTRADFNGPGRVFIRGDGSFGFSIFSNILNDVEVFHEGVTIVEGGNLMDQNGASQFISGVYVLDSPETYSWRLDRSGAGLDARLEVLPGGQLTTQSTVTFDGSGAPVVIVRNGGSMNFASDATLTFRMQYVNEDGSTTIIAPGIIVTIGSAGVGRGTWNVDGALNFGSSGYTFEGANLFAGASSFFDCEAVQFINSTIATGGRFDMSGDRLATVDSSVDNLLSNTIFSEGLVDFALDQNPTREITNHAGASWTFDNVDVTCNQQCTNQNGASISFSDTVWVQNDQTFLNEGDWRFAGISTFSGGFECGADSLVTCSAGAILNLGTPDGASPAVGQTSGRLEVTDDARLNINRDSLVESNWDCFFDDGDFTVDSGTVKYERFVAEDLDDDEDEIEIDFIDANVCGREMRLTNARANMRNDTIALYEVFTSIILVAGGVPNMIVGAPAAHGGGETVLSISRHFAIDSVHESEVVFHSNGVLALVGGVGAPHGDWDNWTRLEVGGTDIGDEPEGFDNNFDLSILRIGPGAHAILEDLIDNGNRDGTGGSEESLYVDTLAFADPDGLLNLSGLHIYYQNLIGDPAQIIDIPIGGGEIALLTDLQVTTGNILSGGLPDLLFSDDSALQTRSGFGNTFIDLHNMTMTVEAATTVPSPASVSLTLEERLDQPAGPSQVRVRNWNTGLLDFVNQHSLGMNDQITSIPDLDAARYVSQAGEIEVQVRHIVFVPFLAFTFRSFVDWVEIAVE